MNSFTLLFNLHQERKGVVFKRMLGDLLKWAVDSQPYRDGFQASPRSLIFNLLIPFLLGILLYLIANPIEKWITRLVGRNG
jgi:hypothetical protein